MERENFSSLYWRYLVDIYLYITETLSITSFVHIIKKMSQASILPSRTNYIAQPRNNKSRDVPDNKTNQQQHITQSCNKGRDVPDNKTNQQEELIPYIPMHRKPIYTMDDRFHREDERLKTFANWPLAWLDKDQLAQTGMFYTGEDDKVKCYFCAVEIGRWQEEDEIVSEHLRWSPNCPLLRRRTTNNMPINAEALQRVLPQISYDVCGANDINTNNNNNSVDVRHYAYSEGSINLQQVSTAGARYFPEYPEYAFESARLRSFTEWPRNMKQKPEQLAEAGFFYTGTGDRVKCFSCGSGLKDWGDDDDPWVEHALWMSHCRFLKLIKGQQFIDSVHSKQKAKCASESNIPPESSAINNIATHLLHDEISNSSTTTTNGEIIGNQCNHSIEMHTESANDLVTSDDITAAATTTTTTRSSSLLIASPAVSEEQLSSTSAVSPCEESTVIANEHCNTQSKNICSEKKSQINIQEEKLCKICYAAEYNTAFLPCGHVVACAKCASSVTRCPLCRKTFIDVMRVYFS